MTTNNSSSTLLAVVVPCFNEEAVLAETSARLKAVFENLQSEHIISSDSFILFVDDGSKDSTWSIIEDLHRCSELYSGLKLAANVGHQNALLSGLAYSKDFADAIISIDADLQDDVNAIKEMVLSFRGGNDIVFGVRRQRRTDSFFKRTTALAFYHLMEKLGVKSIYNHADYRLMSRRAVEQLCAYNEKNLFLRGIVPLIGFQSACVYYDRAERFAGESKYPLKKMINFAIDGITSFSVKPVRLVFAIGVSFILVSLGILVYVLVSLILGRVVPGWSSLILSIWFIGGVVLASLGVVGEYIGKIYIEVKNRPRYNVESVLMNEKQGRDNQIS